MGRLLGMLCVAALAVGLAPSQCIGAVPPMMSYQGKLTDSSGLPVADGSYNMRFYLWSAQEGGEVLWREPSLGTRPVQVTGGIFSVLLGSLFSLPESAFHGETWLQTEVNGTLLEPRVQIVSAGYAMRAQIAEGVPDNTITGAKIVDETIQTQDLSDGAVTPAKIDSTGASPGQAVMFDGSIVRWDTPAGGSLTMPYSGTVSSTSTAFSVANTGGGDAARFESSGSGTSGVYASATSTGQAVHAVANYRATAVKGEAEGPTTKAAWFDINDSANANPALTTITSGTGDAGRFLIDNATSAGFALKAETGGLGNAGYFSVTNAESGAAALYAANSGTGSAAHIQIDSVGSAASALKAETSGIGSAGYFSVGNSGNVSPALHAVTSGAGSAGRLQIDNVENPSPALSVETSGIGPAVKAQGSYAGEFLGSVLIDNLSSSVVGLQVDHGNVLVRGPNNWGWGSSAEVRLGDLYNYVKAVFDEGLRVGVYPGMDALVVRNYGNVGIGTTDPSAKLEVAGDVKVVDDLVVTGAYRGNLGPNDGAPFPRPAYDSGWVTLNRGETKTLTHSVGGTGDYVVDLQLYSAGGGVNGSVGIDTGMVPPPLPTTYVAYGVWWYGLTSTSINIQRGTGDVYGEQARIRIWECR